MEEVRAGLNLAVSQHFGIENQDEVEVIKLQSVKDGHENDSSYIEEVAEELEVTTRFKTTIRQDDGFSPRSGMKMTGMMGTLRATQLMQKSGLLKTGGLNKTVKSNTKMSYGEEQYNTQTILRSPVHELNDKEEEAIEEEIAIEVSEELE